MKCLLRLGRDGIYGVMIPEGEAKFKQIVGESRRWRPLSTVWGLYALLFPVLVLTYKHREFYNLFLGIHLSFK